MGLRFSSRKKDDSEQIKNKYLRKLSIEMVKRCVPDSQIKKSINETEISLSSYIEECEITSFTELESKFGSPKEFCDSNLEIKSNLLAFKQIIQLLLLSCSYVLVLFFGLATFFLFQRTGINWQNSSALFGVFLANSGYGFIGTLFCLNVFTWIVQQYVKERFSPYDARAIFNNLTLVMYWFLVGIWIKITITPYIQFSKVFSDMWPEHMGGLVIEGILRQILLGTYLIIIAILYTVKYVNHYKHKLKEETNEYLIDNLGGVITLFILTSFITPNQGIGLLIIGLGIMAIIVSKASPKVMIAGILALIFQLAIMVEDFTAFNNFKGRETLDRLSMVFGIQATHKYGDWIFLLFFIDFALILIWTSLYYRKRKKTERKLLPQFTYPKGTKQWFSIFLVLITAFAVLGSQPHFTSLSKVSDSYTLYDHPAFDYYYQERTEYGIPAKGRVYISFYTNIEYRVTDDIYALEGEWRVTWRSLDEHSESIIEGSFEPSADPVYSTDQGYYISVRYIIAEVSGPSVITFYYSSHTEGYETEVLPALHIQWSPLVPWFSSAIEICTFITLVLLTFLDWNNKKNLTKTEKKKEGDN